MTDQQPDPNWQQLVADLMASGLTQTAIADLVGAKQATISHLKRGAQQTIAYPEGKRLVDLHRQRCTEQQAAA